MHGVTSQPRAILFDFQLFTATLATEGVVVVTCFFAHEVYDFQFFLALAGFLLGHDQPQKVVDFAKFERESLPEISKFNKALFRKKRPRPRFCPVSMISKAF